MSDEVKGTTIEQLIQIVDNPKLDFETVIMRCQDILAISTVRLPIDSIRRVCNVYFNKNKTSEQLERSNRLFQELDHTNSGIVELDDDTVGLKYS